MMLRAQITQRVLAGAPAGSLEEHTNLLVQWKGRKDALEAELAREIPELNL